MNTLLKVINLGEGHLSQLDRPTMIDSGLHHSKPYIPVRRAKVVWILPTARRKNVKAARKQNVARMRAR
jgi:hypothetical protein